MKAIVFLFLIINSQLLIGQIQFQRAIGGTNQDNAYPVIQTSDGGYAVAGFYFGAGAPDFYIVKLNPNGELQWSRTISGSAGGDEFLFSMIQTTDGGYAVAGWTNSFGSLIDIIIMKLDSSGTLQWTKTVGGTNDDVAYSIIQTTDGGYALAGNTRTFGAGNRDLYIVKLNASGTFQWSKTTGGTSDDVAESIIQTADGGYVVAGHTGSFGSGGMDICIMKLDPGGSLQWFKTVGGTNHDYGYSIIKTSDGGYAVAAQTLSFGAGGYDMYILKLNSSGTLQWNKTIGGTGPEFAYSYSRSIVQTTDGGYAVVSGTQSFGASYDCYIVKLDSIGGFQWNKTIGGTGEDKANSIIQTTDGGYVLAGYTYSFGAGQSDMYIVKLDADGNTCGNSSSPASTVTTPTPSVGSPYPTWTWPVLLTTTRTPTVSSGGTLTTVCITGIIPISNEIPDFYELHQNYPNPFNPNTKIKFSIPLNSKWQIANVKLVVYNLLGQEVTTLVNQQMKPGTYEVDFDGSKYSSGVYFYRLITADFTETKKMILIK